MINRQAGRSALFLVLFAVLAVVLVLLLLPEFLSRPPLRVGSKAFTESGILGEILTLLAQESPGDPRLAHTARTTALSGTQVAWHALKNGSIDAYVEYTGTIRKEILTGQDVPTRESLEQALAQQGIRMSRPLGFNNTYAIGMKKDRAALLGISKISDLRAHPRLKFGFTNEFLDRTDGWPGLRTRYQLPPMDVKGMEHALAYASLQSDSIDATDLYSTDAKIKLYDLLVLADDQQYFPQYDAAVLYRADLETRAPQVIEAWRRLEGHVSETDMVAMNFQVEVDKVPERRVAADFLSKLDLLPPEKAGDVEIEGTVGRLLRLGRQHLMLVALSLAAAILIALPLGIVAAYRPALGQTVLAVVGLLQTIPAIALLVFMIPLLGTGLRPAIAALFLYSLLPIVRNTHAGLHNIPRSLRESAEALGLPSAARLQLIELPMASRTILAGIQTAAVINVGTAALGGFIGAGGFGELIFTGLYKDDKALILQGAIPTALLALLVQGLFELAQRLLVPKGLRLRRDD